MRERRNCLRRSPQSQPGPDATSLKKALSEAVGAGQMDLALSLARSSPAAKLPSDARLLLVAEEIKRKHPDARAAVAGAPDRPAT